MSEWKLKIELRASNNFGSAIEAPIEVNIRNIADLLWFLGELLSYAEGKLAKRTRGEKVE